MWSNKVFGENSNTTCVFNILIIEDHKLLYIHINIKFSNYTILNWIKNKVVSLSNVHPYYGYLAEHIYIIVTYGFQTVRQS
jgi:hypothetical protein